MSIWPLILRHRFCDIDIPNIFYFFIFCQKGDQCDSQELEECERWRSKWDVRMKARNVLRRPELANVLETRGTLLMLWVFPSPKISFGLPAISCMSLKSRFLGMEIQPITAMLHLAPYNAFKVHFMTWRYHIQVLYKLY